MDRDFSTGSGTQNPNVGTAGRNVADQARQVGNEAKDKVREGLDEGRRAMNDVMGDVQEKGRRIADRARQWGNEAKERTLRVARDVGGYAEDNVTVVAIASLAVGILIGRYLVPTSD